VPDRYREKRAGPRRVIRQNIWEQCRRPRGFRPRPEVYPPVCLQRRARKEARKTPIGRRFTSEVGISFLDKYHCLARAGLRVRLDASPPPSSGVSVRAHRRTSFAPKAEFGTSRTMLHTSLSAKKIVARELQVVLSRLPTSQKKGVAAPAGKEAGIACLCNLRFRAPK